MFDVHCFAVYPQNKGEPRPVLSYFCLRRLWTLDDYGGWWWCCVVFVSCAWHSSTDCGTLRLRRSQSDLLQGNPGVVQCGLPACPTFCLIWMAHFEQLSTKTQVFFKNTGLSVCVCGTCMLLACGLYDGCNPSISTTCVVCARPLLWELYLVSQDFFILQVF